MKRRTTPPAAQIVTVPAQTGQPSAAVAEAQSQLACRDG